MKVQVDGKLILELNDTQKRVIQDEIPKEIFQSDMERRIHYILTHKYEQCFKKLKEEWEPKLSKRVPSVPTDPDKLAELIFSQPDYKSRSQREEDLKTQDHLRRTGQV